jgi:hypothetical protein
MTSRAGNAGKRGRSGTFAVGAGDQHTLKAALRMAQPTCQHTHVFKIKFASGGQFVAQSEQLLNG